MATTTAREGSPRRLTIGLPSRASTAFLIGGAAAIAIYFALSPDAKSVFYVVIGIVPAAVVAVRAGHLEHERAAWYCFAAGLAFTVSGDAVTGFYEIHLNREPPTPSAADVLYLAAYPALLVGIYLLLRGFGGIHTRVAVLDAVIVTVAVGTVQWIFFVEPNLHASGTLTARAVGMAYPTMDLLVLVGLVQLMLGSRTRFLAYRLLVVSVGLWIAGDEIYGLSVNNYTAGGWVDAFWLGSYVVWGAAALEPSASTRPTRDRREVPRLTNRRLGLLASALLTVPVVISIEHYWPHHKPHAMAVAIGSAVLGLLVIARLAGLVRAVESARVSERMANTRLRELDRLKDEFVSTVSHELRTPLTSISGYAELAREQADEEARGYLDIVQRNTSRLLALVNDLLLVARLQSGPLALDFEEIDVGALAAESVAVAKPHAASGNVELRLRVAGDRVVIRGDRRRLGQVVDNLVSNAIKFSPDGGGVEVTVGAQNGGVEIEVIDHGIGVGAGELNRLFERFFRSQGAIDRQIPGTGLGLYISKSIVEAHGGRIGARAVQEGGLSIKIELPSAGGAS